MKAFLDTNILLDYIIENRPHQKESKIILEGARRNSYNVVVTTQSVIDTAYIAKREGAARHDTDAFFDWLALHINMEGIDSFDILEALKSDNPDFEDSAQFAHAETANCDVFITSDKSMLMRKSDTGMSVMTPEEFVARMQ